ncbi:hypothetical protein DEO72_LG6g1249 [Vigna unguiculata]|uniref:Secreted protein n=1 Tax=Vigna unguiculata TaxID=3917 RepID=A0A4D6M6W4_VIGUN|nr:hypothetical protein DEO72_LG6g1249 [Vigna unguiculata]
MHFSLALTVLAIVLPGLPLTLQVREARPSSCGVFVLYRLELWCEQWRTLIDSPRRARPAQARCVGAEFPARMVAQATRVCFERADDSPRREGLA